MRPPINAGSHHQPRRLVAAGVRRSMLSGDRLMGIDGLGTLGADTGETDLGTYYDDSEVEGDSDYSGLVTAIVNAAGKITPAALTLAGQLAAKKGIDLNSILGMAQTRATAVQNGTASMPTAAWIGIGVAAVALLGLVFMMGRR